MRYVGSELEIFQHASRWKAYWTSLVIEHVSGSVLEVGAGLGANTFLFAPHVSSTWTCLDPDASLLGALRNEMRRRGRSVETVCGVLRDLPPERTFDTILYIDVLEHIDDDRGETTEATRRLRPGGNIIVLSPAFQFLYSPFDRAIGHFRRYTKQSLRDLMPTTLEPRLIAYLDAPGFLLSAANRLLLRQKQPTLRQILFWDRRVIPVSRFIDPLIQYSFGRSILGVWRKRGDG